MKLTLVLTHACNLRCAYCYTGEKFHKTMSWETTQRAVGFGLEQADRGVLHLAFFGGEPLLEARLIERIMDDALLRAAEAGVRLCASVATNGTLLDEHCLELLGRHRFDVQVSLDGCAAAHDAVRRFANGRPSHAQVVANLRRLLSSGLRVRVVAVIDPANAAHLGPSFDCLMDLGVRHIHFAPNYSGAWDEPARERLVNGLRDMADRYVARMRANQDVRLDPFNGKIVTHLNDGYRPCDLCKFGQGSLAVAPSGRIYPCDRIVGEDDGTLCLGDVQRGIDDALRDSLVTRKNELNAQCASCSIKHRCAHWCGCTNFETTGDVGRPSPTICWFQRQFIAESDRIANLLFEEQNATFMRRFYWGAGARCS